MNRPNDNDDFNQCIVSPLQEHMTKIFNTFEFDISQSIIVSDNARLPADRALSAPPHDGRPTFDRSHSDRLLTVPPPPFTKRLVSRWSDPTSDASIFASSFPFRPPLTKSMSDISKVSATVCRWSDHSSPVSAPQPRKPKHRHPTKQAMSKIHDAILICPTRSASNSSLSTSSSNHSMSSSSHSVASTAA